MATIKKWGACLPPALPAEVSLGETHSPPPHMAPNAAPPPPERAGPERTGRFTHPDTRWTRNEPASFSFGPSTRVLSQICFPSNCPRSGCGHADPPRRMRSSPSPPYAYLRQHRARTWTRRDGRRKEQARSGSGFTGTGQEEPRSRRENGLAWIYNDDVFIRLEEQ
ncbi:hypothetical protein WMY93_013353 [Mugilogobius chulae]|uniref:Uncharacterized protein n=1 Tax=Mugilogobius chulae TaxID=88201 RepID=A0AAW0P8W2_9GOBI